MAKRDVPVEIAGKVYALRYNFDALTYIEDATDKPFSDVVTALTQSSMKNLKVLFHAGLLKNHPEIAIGDVAEILDECDLKTAIMSVVEAINNYFKPSDAKKKTPDDNKVVSISQTEG